MMAVASSPTAQPRMNFQAVSSQAGCEAVLPQIPPRRANTQGNDDMAAITGCCKTHNLFFSFLLLSLSTGTFVLPAEIRREPVWVSY